MPGTVKVQMYGRQTEAKLRYMHIHSRLTYAVHTLAGQIGGQSCKHVQVQDQGSQFTKRLCRPKRNGEIFYDFFLVQFIIHGSSIIYLSINSSRNRKERSRKRRKRKSKRKGKGVIRQPIVQSSPLSVQVVKRYIALTEKERRARQLQKKK